MSNVFRGSGITYFQVPNYLVTSGLLVELRPAAINLCMILLQYAQRYTKVEFTLTNNDITTYCRLAANSIAKARTELAEHGFIRFERRLGGAYHYVLCDPESQQPLGDPRRRAEAGAGVSAENATEALRKPPAPIAGNRRFGQRFRDWIAELDETDFRRYYERRIPNRRFDRAGDQWMTLCPFHPDHDPSLSLNFRGGVWKCHGCHKGGGMLEFEMQMTGVTNKPAAIKSIVEIVGRPLGAALPPTTVNKAYIYVDETGTVLFSVQKLANGRFKTRRWDGKSWVSNTRGLRRVLYHLDEVIRARIIIVCEGEKDADRVRELFNPDEGIAVTTSPFGASAWDDSYGQWLAGKIVIIIPDNDPPGHTYAANVARSARARGVDNVRIVYLPGLGPSQDVSDYLDTHMKYELEMEMKTAPKWEDVKEAV